MVEVRRLTPSELDDFLDFMGGPAFATNPQWAGCYCQFYLNSQAENADLDANPDTKPARNRDSACERINSGTMRGYLAYEGDKVIAWMAANKANNFVALPPTSESAARILCFVVDQAHQGQGVSARLLDFAITDLAAQGFETLEAAPMASDSFESWGYRGKLSTFLKAGFEQGPMIDDKHCIVFRKLTD